MHKSLVSLAVGFAGGIPVGVLLAFWVAGGDPGYSLVLSKAANGLIAAKVSRTIGFGRQWTVFVTSKTDLSTVNWGDEAPVLPWGDFLVKAIEWRESGDLEVWVAPARRGGMMVPAAIEVGGKRVRLLVE